MCDVCSSSAFSLAAVRPAVLGAQNAPADLRVDLNVGVVKDAGGTDAGHQEEGDPHRRDERVRRRVRQPVVLVKGFRLEGPFGVDEGVLAGAGAGGTTAHPPAGDGLAIDPSGKRDEERQRERERDRKKERQEIPNERKNTVRRGNSNDNNNGGNVRQQRNSEQDVRRNQPDSAPTSEKR